MKASIKKVLLSALLVGSATTVWAFMAPPVFDQPIGPYCPGGWEFEIRSTNSELQFENPVRSEGTPIFGETKVVRRSDQPAYVERSFVGLDGRGHDPLVGDISWTVDRERQAAAEAAGLLTTVRANQFGSDLPASTDIRFFVEARLGSQPDRVYRSVEQVRFVSDNITTYPFQQEELRIAEPVDFYDSETGEVAFRIEAGRGTATSR